MNVIFFGDSLTEGIPGISYINILKEKLPQHALVNCGKGGDTVISLYRRIKKINFSETYDIAFLWVGVNDVLVHVSKKYPIIKLCCHQPWAKNVEKFISYYQKLLEIVMDKSKKVFTVSPSIIGEDIHNKWNKKLGKLSAEIRRLSSDYESVEYIDVHKELISRLSNKKSPNFILNSIARDVVAAWLFNSSKRVERKSRERGLLLTLDGVHFNSDGAKIIADVFYKEIVGEMTNDL